VARRVPHLRATPGSLVHGEPVQHPDLIRSGSGRAAASGLGEAVECADQPDRCAWGSGRREVM